jgi:nucleotide-binding universal stress UspA family protein
MFEKVLFPIDQSRETQDAIAIVSNIVKTYNSQLYLLSVVEKSEENPSMMTDADTVCKLLESAKTMFAKEQIEAKIVEKEGMPPFVICDVADEITANLIIMGCRGLGLTQEGVEESVTNRVINLAPCPVLVVP